MAGLNQIQTRFPKNFAWLSLYVASDRAHYRHIQFVSQVKIESLKLISRATNRGLVACVGTMNRSSPMQGRRLACLASAKARARTHTCRRLRRRGAGGTPAYLAVHGKPSFTFSNASRPRTGRARHSVRAAIWLCTNGAQGTDAPHLQVRGKPAFVECIGTMNLDLSLLLLILLLLSFAHFD